MKKILLFAMVILLISFTVTVFALPRIATAQKIEFKTMLQNYLSPVLHGYGIGFTGDNYITAKWYITGIKILNRTNVKNVIGTAKEEGVTDWSTIRERVRAELESSGMFVRKGRIRIDGTMYLLTNIITSDTSASADIREIPNWENCKEQNMSAETCENNATKVGDISVTKRTKAQQEIAGEPRVWAGTLNFNGTAYTFVTFVYPR